ncbi:MAG: hypothetical protein KBC73_08390 [Burkholderiaceae bacterium]|nr:hypothetical protein [Burkholderiaceae bacterium]
MSVLLSMRGQPRRVRALLLGGLLALLASALLATATVQWRQEHQALEQQWRSERDARLATAARPGPTPSAGPDDAAARLQAALPPPGQAPQRVAELLALARRQGLTLRGAQQRLPDAQRRADQAAPGRLELALLAEADYGQLRRFVAEALAQDAGLVLGSLRLQRADARTARLQAELQWVLLSRPRP